jgi:hypothetical protein
MKKVLPDLSTPTTSRPTGEIAKPSVGPGSGTTASTKNRSDCAVLERVLGYYGKRFKDMTTKYLEEIETIEWGLEQLEPYMDDLPSLQHLEVMRDTLRSIQGLKGEMNLKELSEEVPAIAETLWKIHYLVREMYLPDLQGLEAVETHLKNIAGLLHEMNLPDIEELEYLQETLETIQELL